MKKLLVILLLALPTLCFAENKIFFDNVTGKEVCDLSGKKTVEEINSEFCGNYTDITSERKAQEETNRIAEQVRLEKQKTDEAKAKEELDKAERDSLKAEIKKEILDELKK